MREREGRLGRDRWRWRKKKGGRTGGIARRGEEGKEVEWKGSRMLRKSGRGSMWSGGEGSRRVWKEERLIEKEARKKGGRMNRSGRRVKRQERR